VNFGPISAQKCSSACDARCEIFKELQGVEQIQNHIFSTNFSIYPKDSLEGTVLSHTSGTGTTGEIKP